MSTTSPHSPPPVSPPRLSRPLRWLLIGSLALNVLVIGSVAGLSLRQIGAEPPRASAGRSVGFGPWSGGLTREDHKALRQAFDAEGYDFRAEVRADRADRERLLAGLRADPFDVEAMRVVTSSLEARAGARMALGNRLILEHVAALSPEARRAMADRIEAEAAARHRSRHEDKKGKSRD